MKQIKLRDAIRLVLRRAAICKATSDRDGYTECREWLKSNLRNRNKQLSVFIPT